METIKKTDVSFQKHIKNKKNETVFSWLLIILENIMSILKLFMDEAKQPETGKSGNTIYCSGT